MFVEVETLTFGDYTAEFGEVDEFEIYGNEVVIKSGTGMGWFTFPVGTIVNVLKFA